MTTSWPGRARLTSQRRAVFGVLMVVTLIVLGIGLFTTSSNTENRTAPSADERSTRNEQLGAERNPQAADSQLVIEISVVPEIDPRWPTMGTTIYGESASAKQERIRQLREYELQQSRVIELSSAPTNG